MRRRPSYIVLLMALLFVGNLAFGQGSPGPTPKKPRTLDDYKPRTLKEVTAETKGAESRGNKEETMIVHANILPSRVKAIYAGPAREFLRNKREVLRQWARLYAGSPEGYTDPYETEILFNESGAEYWLAVKKGVLPRLKLELKRGEAVDLYLIRVGAAKVGDEWESVLLVESFRKPNSSN